jgi:hypothetical protein
VVLEIMEESSLKQRSSSLTSFQVVSWRMAKTRDIKPPITHDQESGRKATQEHLWLTKIYPTAHLIPRLVGDVESDPKLALHSAGLRSRFCTKILREFFEKDLDIAYANRYLLLESFYMAVNLIAHWANLGYVEEDAIRNHILQSLISHCKLYDHQAVALIILFKIAGATFGAYADPAVVDRCFELLKCHNYSDRVKGRLIQASAISLEKRPRN